MHFSRRKPFIKTGLLPFLRLSESTLSVSTSPPPASFWSSSKVVRNFWLKSIEKLCNHHQFSHQNMYVRKKKIIILLRCLNKRFTNQFLIRYSSSSLLFCIKGPLFSYYSNDLKILWSIWQNQQKDAELSKL